MNIDRAMLISGREGIVITRDCNVLVAHSCNKQHLSCPEENGNIISQLLLAVLCILPQWYTVMSTLT